MPGLKPRENAQQNRFLSRMRTATHDNLLFPIPAQAPTQLSGIGRADTHLAVVLQVTQHLDPLSFDTQGLEAPGIDLVLGGDPVDQGEKPAAEEAGAHVAVGRAAAEAAVGHQDRDSPPPGRQQKVRPHLELSLIHI